MLEVDKDIRISAIRKNRCAGPKSIKKSCLSFKMWGSILVHQVWNMFSFAKALGVLFKWIIFH